MCALFHLFQACFVQSGAIIIIHLYNQYISCLGKSRKSRFSRYGCCIGVFFPHLIDGSLMSPEGGFSRQVGIFSPAKNVSLHLQVPVQFGRSLQGVRWVPCVSRALTGFSLLRADFVDLDLTVYGPLSLGGSCILGTMKRRKHPCLA